MANSEQETNDLIRELGHSGIHSVCGPESTLLVIKPHAVAQGHTPEIIAALSDAGLSICGARMLHMDVDRSETFFAVYKGIIKEYSKCVSELASMPCVALEIICAHGAAHQILRDLCGPYDVEIARHLFPTSLRARFGESRVKNAVHCTDLAVDGQLETRFFFKDNM